MENVTAKLIINSTQIPNIILDEWQPELTPAEFEVVLVIARQTYGWHKETDRISYSQMQTKTPYKADALVTAIKSLRSAGRIIVTDEDGNQLFTRDECRGKSLYYKLNIDTIRNNRKVVTNYTENRNSKNRNTKETNTKYSFNKLKEGDKSPATKKCFNPDGSHKSCVDNIEFLDEKYNKHLIANPKNFRYLEALYKAGASDAVIDRIVSKFSKDPFYSEQGWDLKNVFDQFTKGGANVTARY